MNNIKLRKFYEQQEKNNILCKMPKKGIILYVYAAKIALAS